MSEPRAVYYVDYKKPLSKAKFRQLDCCRTFVDPAYRSPTAIEIQMQFDLAG